jgi:hypothetical protein
MSYSNSLKQIAVAPVSIKIALRSFGGLVHNKLNAFFLNSKNDWSKTICQLFFRIVCPLPIESFSSDNNLSLPFSHFYAHYQENLSHFSSLLRQQVAAPRHRG